MRVHHHNVSVLKPAVAALLALAVSGCLGRGEEIATAPPPVSQPKVTSVDLRPMCGTLKNWTAEEMTAVADALAALPASNPIFPFIGDYRRMRDEARACQKAAVPR